MPSPFTFACASAMMIASAAFAQDGNSVPAKPINPAAAPAAQAEDKKPAKSITIGDTAPAIDISDWIKGDKVAKFEDGKVYVVEFWATWCGPCKVSMPHLSESQAQYKDYGVTFIGISDEPLDTVTKWLDTTDKKTGKKWSELIAYTLTTDPDKSVKTDYFAAANQRGIPSAFIVGKDQKIEWIGNPHPQSPDGFDKALEAVVKDQWDRNAFKAKWEGEQIAEKAQAESQGALRKAMQAKDWKTVVATCDQVLAKSPKSKDMAMLKFHTLVAEMNEPTQGYEFLKTYLSENYWDDAMTLNEFAWTIVDDATIKPKDIDFATGLAMRANKFTGESNPAILDTLARCWFEKGNYGEAVRIQKMAAAMAKDDEMGTEIKATLKKYEEAWNKSNGN